MSHVAARAELTTLWVLKAARLEGQRGVLDSELRRRGIKYPRTAVTFLRVDGHQIEETAVDGGDISYRLVREASEGQLFDPMGAP